MQIVLFQTETFLYRRINLTNGHWCIHGTDMDHGPTFFSMQINHTHHRPGAVEFKYKRQVLVECLFCGQLIIIFTEIIFAFSEGNTMPVLAFIFTEV